MEWEEHLLDCVETAHRVSPCDPAVIREVSALIYTLPLRALESLADFRREPALVPVVNKQDVQ